MNQMLAAVYFFVGLFVAIHQDAWQRQCEKPIPVALSIGVGALWPVWMLWMIYDDTANATSFRCPPGPYWAHHT